MSREYYEESLNNSRDYSDRYKNCKVLKDIDTGDKLLSTREIFDIPVSSTDQYHELKSSEILRLDKLAQIYYKNPLLWWVIAQANDIYDPMISLETGTILRIPSIETLYGYNGLLL